MKTSSYLLIALMLGLASLATGDPNADDTAAASVRQETGAISGPMTKETYAILRAAVADATTGREDLQKKNLDALERLAKVSWPRVGKLPWVHVFLKGAQEGEYTGAWKLAELEHSIRFMAAGLRETEIESERIERIEPADFKADLNELIRFLNSRDERQKRKWDFSGIQGRGFPAHPGVFLLRYAYAAADHGLKDETHALVSEVFKRVRRGLPNLYDEMVWQVLRPAMFEFRAGGSRKAFLSTCKELLATYPGSRYDEQLESLIGPMEREAAAPRPAFLQKKPEELSQEEQMRCWIYMLRDVAGHQWSDPGYPQLFSMSHRPTAADQLIAIGPPAIPYLIEVLEDDTPTRTIAWQRSFYSVHFVLRRQDVAMKCLERIVGCRFYDEAATFIHLYMDKPERRNSAIANVREWWSRSQGASQARMIRNQLALGHKNVSLRASARAYALKSLAMLEGPEAVVEGPYRDMLKGSGKGLLDRIDPRTPVRAAFKKFWDNDDAYADMYIIKYGDKRTYREMAHRFEASGRLGSPSWSLGDQAQYVVRYGKNWAIPILALMLKETEMTGARSGSEIVRSQAFSAADEAMELFQKLTGKDFGYERRGEVSERLKAIEKARTWWAEGGQEALAKEIAKDHPPVVNPGDLFLSDDEIARRVEAIEGDDETLRRDTIASLDEVHSYKIQRALLNALGKENEPDERIAILRALEAHASLWHLPTLAEVMEKDSHVEARVLAAHIIKAVVGYKSTTVSWLWLETRNVALDAARALAQNDKTPPEVRHAAAEILIAWDWFVDHELLRELATDPAFKNHEALRSFIVRKDEVLAQFPPPQEAEE